MITLKEFETLLASAALRTRIPIDPRVRRWQLVDWGALVYGDTTIHGTKQGRLWRLNEGQTTKALERLTSFEPDKATSEVIPWDSPAPGWRAWASSTFHPPHAGGDCWLAPRECPGFLNHPSSESYAFAGIRVRDTITPNLDGLHLPAALASLLDRAGEIMGLLLQRDEINVCVDCARRRPLPDRIQGEPPYWHLLADHSRRAWRRSTYTCETVCPDCRTARGSRLPSYQGEFKGMRYRQKGRPPASEFRCVMCSESGWEWDHCHTHGFIRAPLCKSCNIKEGNSSRGREKQPAVIAAYYANCPQCEQLGQWS